MNDLHDRFRALDDLHAPDLWGEIEGRALAAQPTHSRPLPWVLIALILLLALGLGTGVLIGSGVIKLPVSVEASASPSATSPSASFPASDLPSSLPSPEPFWATPGPWASPASPVPLDGVGSQLLSGTLYTSNRFKPPIAFRLTAFGNKEQTGVETDWCGVQSSARSIVMPWLMGCQADLRILRPYAVDCGTPDSHPDADTLATAILANPRLKWAHDYGSLQRAASLAPGIDFSGLSGRVIDLNRYAGYYPFDATATNPDHCRFLAAPGSSDPVIELRADLTALLFLIDVNGELVVIRVAGGGYDAPTGAEAQARGYKGGDAVGYDAGLLGTIRDFRFIR